MVRQQLWVMAVFSLIACTPGGGNFTLYRNSAVDEKMRIHVASFDSLDGAAYNSENCKVAEELFKNQPNVTVRYWCEKGSYAK